MMLKKLLATLTAIAAMLGSYAQANDTLIYSVVNSGRIKGFDKIWKNADGSYGEWYQFNDRGRGDSMRVLFRTDEQGFPQFMQASGNDYMKNAVHEEFSLSNGLAKWTNNAENEEKQVSGKVFYYGLKANGGNLVKALKSNQNKVKLLPYGEVELKILQEHKLPRRSGNQQPATSNQQLATSNQQLATSNQQPTTSNQQPTTSNQQPATSN